MVKGTILGAKIVVSGHFTNFRDIYTKPPCSPGGAGCACGNGGKTPGIPMAWACKSCDWWASSSIIGSCCCCCCPVVCFDPLLERSGRLWSRSGTPSSGRFSDGWSDGWGGVKKRSVKILASRKKWESRKTIRKRWKQVENRWNKGDLYTNFWKKNVTFL